MSAHAFSAASAYFPERALARFRISGDKRTCSRCLLVPKGAFEPEASTIPGALQVFAEDFSQKASCQGGDL
jgi:hypothetical protein